MTSPNRLFRGPGEAPYGWCLFRPGKHLSSSALGYPDPLNKRIGESGGTLKLCDIKPSCRKFRDHQTQRLFEIHENKNWP